MGFGRRIVLVRGLVELTPVCLLDEPMMGSASLDLDGSTDAALPTVIYVTYFVLFWTTSSPDPPPNVLEELRTVVGRLTER